MLCNGFIGGTSGNFLRHRSSINHLHQSMPIIAGQRIVGPRLLCFLRPDFQLRFFQEDVDRWITGPLGVLVKSHSYDFSDGSKQQMYPASHQCLSIIACLACRLTLKYAV